MTDQVNLHLIWAQTGGVEDPGDVKYSTGWVSEIPTYENFNFVLQNHSSNLLALAEKGAFEWDSNISYESGATVRKNGIFYICKTPNSGQDPTTDTLNQYWVHAPVIGNKPQTEALEKLGLQLNNVQVRSSTNLWEGSDLSIINKTPIIGLVTENEGTKNWLFANVAGEPVLIDVGTTSIPDNRNISLSNSNVYKIYTEYNPPTQGEIDNTIPSNPVDDNLYARLNNQWAAITSNLVSDTVPDRLDIGQGWYNTLDGHYYLCVEDSSGDKQFVLANPTIIPEGVAIPSGTRMLFQQSTAPTGWTKVTEHNNKALRVVSGNASGKSGANFTDVFKTWTIAGSTSSNTVSGTSNSSGTGVSVNNSTAGGTVNDKTALTGSTNTVTVSGTTGGKTLSGTSGNTTLLTSQIPNHDHTIYQTTNDVTHQDNVRAAYGVSGEDNAGSYARTNPTVINGDGNNLIGQKGSSGSHNHSISISSHDHSFSDSHSHTVSVNNHNHTFTGIAHNHTITDPEHTHSFTSSSHSHTFSENINLDVAYVDLIIAVKD